MATLTELAISAGIIIVFIAFIISDLVGYINSYTGTATTSELQGAAKAVFNNLFTSQGQPVNWQYSSSTPYKIGLIEPLYRMPVIVAEANGSSRGNVSVNLTVSFDRYCTNTTIDKTIVMYDSNNTYVPLALYNETSCPGVYLNQSDIVFYTTLNALQQNTFYVYYSADQNVSVSRPAIAFPSIANYSATVYPPETINQVGASEVSALNNTGYTRFLEELASDYNFNVTITTP